MMLNRNNVLADNLGLKVEYKGVSPQGQHLFSSGGPLIGYVFNTLEEAVAKFGARINLHEKQNALSFFFKEGLASKSYAPLKSAKAANLIEYGLGRMKQLIDKAVAAPPAPEPKPVVRFAPRQAPAPPKKSPLASQPAPHMSSTPPKPPAPRPKSGLQLGELRQKVGK